MKSFAKKIVDPILDSFSPNTRDNVLGLSRFTFHARQHPSKQLIVFFVDGRGFHGGLCDRFKGIVSVYHYCLCNGICFKINYTYPFKLSDFLEENEVEWMLTSEDELTFNIFEAKYVNLIQESTASRLLKLKTKRQIHVYANRDITAELNDVYGTNYQWGMLFKKLFKPTAELRRWVDRYKEMIGGDYVAMQLRFQNLLGDTIEDDGSPELNTEEKEKLIGKCKDALLRVQSHSSLKRILVTSDSYVFVQRITGMDNIYVFPEKIVHIDTVKAQEGHGTFLKTFVDFYLLSESRKIYSLGTRQMYKSDFPVYASKLNKIPFERILID